jgi:hypothetical protein
LQDGAKIEDFMYLSEGKVFPVPTLFLSPLCPRTSKHLSMGGGRYYAILEFKGEQKNMRKRKKEKKKNEKIYT